MDPASLTRRVLLIKERLRSVSANDLQRLAEDLARIKSPTKFSGQIIFQGRNVEGQTTKGWPDAYSDAPNDAVHALEATRERATWKKHLDADLVKAASGKYKTLASYFFVGGYPDHEPTEKELTAYRAKFKALGLSPGDITLLVGHGLAEELARPECARIVYQLLGVRPEPRLFGLLKPGALHDRQLAGFQPTEEDFASGLVWEPPLVEQVATELQGGEAVLVRGHGASGKTTFAQSIAQRWNPKTVYYLDLADALSTTDSSPNAIAGDLVEFGGNEVLFVVDNVHLDDGLALKIFSTWYKYSRKSASLLLLGREVSLANGSPLGPLKPHILYADADAVVGVVNRLLTRAGHASRKFSIRDVQRWLATFGGGNSGNRASVDLVAFGAAAERRLDDLARGGSELRADDAIEAVRERYLTRLKPEERANLILLSGLAPFEVSLSEAALADRSIGFTVCNQNLGIVLREQVGRGARVVYRLAHAALGDLILAATGSHDQIERFQHDVAERDPATGVQLLGRMPAGPAQKRLQTVLRDVLSRESWIDKCASLPAFIGLFRAARYRKLLPDDSLAAQMIASSHLEKLYANERDLVILTQLQALVEPFSNEVTQHLGDLSRRHKELFADRVCATRVDEVKNFILSNPVGQEILTLVDAENWNGRQPFMTPPQPSSAVSAARRLESWGRADLILGAIESLVRKPDPTAWGSSTSDGDLRHLSHLLRLTVPLGRDIRLRCLQAIATPDWLDHQYRSLRTGALSAAILSLHQHGDEAFLRVLDRESLAKRLSAQLHAHATTGDDDTVKTFTLFGTAELIRRGDSFADFAWPTGATIEMLLGHGAMRSAASNDLGTYEMQYWMGLRRMMAWREPVRVSFDRIQGFERRLMHAVAPSERAECIRGTLLDWTSQCVAAGGILIAPTNR